MFIKRLIHRFRFLNQAGVDNASGAAGTTSPAPAVVADQANTQVDTASTQTGTAAAALTPEQTAQAGADAVKAAEDAAKAKDAPKLEGAPETYEFKLAEGHTLDAGVQAQFEAVARELNLPNATAQKLIETMGPQIASAQALAAEKVKEEWTTAAKGDKEFGGDQLQANLGVAKKAMDAFGTPELKNFLNESGLGNHPEMIRMMYRAGKALSTDKFVPGSAGAGTGKSAAKTLYPNSN